MKHLFLFLNKLCNTNLSKARKSEKQNVNLENQRQHLEDPLSDNFWRHTMSLCEEDDWINNISKTRGHLLAPGDRTRCIHSQLMLQSTGQIQLMLSDYSRVCCPNFKTWFDFQLGMSGRFDFQLGMSGRVDFQPNVFFCWETNVPKLG